MNLQLILFYVFAAVILSGALCTVTAKNPVHAALFLVLTFCASAMMWLLMQAEFLGIVLIVVYVGAVMVLFLFVVMMLNIDVEQMRAGFWRHAPVAFSVGLVTAALLIAVLINPQLDLGGIGQFQDVPADYSDVHHLGMQIYTIYLLPFELAAVLLVLGMVAAIALVHRKNTNPRQTNVSEQVKVQAKDCFRIVKMEPEVMQAAVVEEKVAPKEGEV